MRKETTHRWLSVAEIAEQLGMKPTSINRGITRNGMPAHKLGQLWKFRIDEVDRWVWSGKAGQTSAAAPDAPEGGP